MKKILLLISFFAVAACSSGGGGGEETLQPLNDDQKKVLKSVGQEITDVSSATSSYTQPFNRSLRQVISGKGQQYKVELNVAENSGKCEVVKEGLPTGSSQGFPEELDIEFEVTDSDSGVCPFYSAMTFVMENTENTSNQITSAESKVTSEAEFQVMEAASLYLAMDITSYKSSYKAQQTSVQSKTGLIENAMIEGTGAFESKTQGSMGFTVRGTSNDTYSANGDVEIDRVLTVRYALKDFTAVGVIRGVQTSDDKKIEYTYLINGEEVKKREYQKYFGTVVGNISISID